MLKGKISKFTIYDCEEFLSFLFNFSDRTNGHPIIQSSSDQPALNELIVAGTGRDLEFEHRSPSIENTTLIYSGTLITNKMSKECDSTASKHHSPKHRPQQRRRG